MEKQKEKTENQKEKTIIIGTSELTEYVNQFTGLEITPKRLRSYLRNDTVLSETFDDGTYTKYKFEYPSKLTDYIINRFAEIAKEKRERLIQAKKRKEEKKKKKNKVLTLDDNGKVIEKEIK